MDAHPFSRDTRRASKAALLASALLAPMLLAACGDDNDQPQAMRFSDVDACIQLYPHDAAMCRDSFAAARTQHESAMPRFTTRETCENPQNGFQQCVQNSNGIWMPLMAGFLIGKLASGGWTAQPALPMRRDGQIDCRFAPDPRACNNAQSRSGGGGGVYANYFAYGRGSSIAAPSSSTASSFSAPRPAAAPPSSVGTSAVSRGGFGATASSVGSTGGA